ncbi:hypothetical protein Tco_0021960, partial [Tanacetum coccineum]
VIRLLDIVSDVVVAAAVEDCSGYFSANVEFVHVCSWLLMPGLPDDRCGSAGVKLLMTLADIN